MAMFSALCTWVYWPLWQSRIKIKIKLKILLFWMAKTRSSKMKQTRISFPWVSLDSSFLACSHSSYSSFISRLWCHAKVKSARNSLRAWGIDINKVNIKIQMAPLKVKHIPPRAHKKCVWKAWTQCYLLNFPTDSGWSWSDPRWIPGSL